jgi:hypothetical protein
MFEDVMGLYEPSIAEFGRQSALRGQMTGRALSSSLRRQGVGGLADFEAAGAGRGSILQQAMFRAAQEQQALGLAQNIQGMRAQAHTSILMPQMASYQTGFDDPRMVMETIGNTASTFFSGLQGV